MGRVLKRYVLVEKLSDMEHFITTQHYKDEYQQCRVIQSNEKSDIQDGDRILVGNKITFDKAAIGEKSFFIYEDDVYGIMKEDAITPRRDYVYIEADKNKKKVIKHGSLEIVKDTTYDPLGDKNVVQDGIILSHCSKAIDSYFHQELKIEVEDGDHVYTHHFLTDKDNEREFNGKKYYEIKYEDLYCKIKEGEIVMLNNWNFLTPVLAEKEISESGIILDFKQKNQIRVGVINHSCKSLEERDIKKGDKVFFKIHREYKIQVEGTTYYRIETDDILYKID